MSNRKLPLDVRIAHGQLIISVGVETLCHAVSEGRRYGMGEINITDSHMFVSALMNELTDEEEDGSTLIHRMLDEAATKAIENGAEGAEYADA